MPVGRPILSGIHWIWIAGICGCVLSSLFLPRIFGSLRPQQRWERVSLPSVRGTHGLTGRSMIYLPAGPCIVLRYPPLTPPAYDMEGYRTLTSKDPSSTDRLLAYGSLSTFNCATYAFGEVLDLQPDEWIEPLARLDTFYSIPAQVVLDSFYDLVANHQIEQLDWSTLEQDQGFRDGDVIVYSKLVHGKEMIVHLGKIARQDSINKLHSKLGNGPIAESSLQRCAETFAADSVLHYRIR
ncbi:MAG: hypothetical protein KDB22_03035 [Planctomycetales bacterium]|nr:hypothetical protein [Planctomycetales bacterium]